VIISFDRKFIFVAIPKTAGHAIRASLRPLMAEKDWEQSGLCEKMSFPIPALAKFGHGHLTIRQIEKHLPPGACKDFFSFAFVRNPYDRFVSFSAFINRNNDRMKKDPRGTMKGSFKKRELLLSILMRPQHEFITRPDGKIMVSYVARYEAIQSEFDAIRCKIGGAPYLLPKINSSQRTFYRDYYDEELQQMVLDYYKKDFDLLGYDRQL
jgi:hypothetical protein